MTGSHHSGDPIFFLWPGQYTAETSTIQIPTESNITVQMSKGASVAWSVNSGLFHLNSGCKLTISGASQADPYRSTFAEEFLGVNGPLIKLDSTTEDSNVTLEGIRARVVTDWPILDLQPGITGDGTCEVTVNECGIWTDNSGFGNMSAIIIGTNNKTDVSIDNSVIQQSRGDDTYAVINHQSGKLFLSNSTVSNRWTNVGIGSAPAINIRIPSGGPSSDYFIFMNNTVFYSGIPKAKDVIKDLGANTGSLNMFINSNCSTNMNLPSTTHTGVLIKKGPGILELTELPYPLW